jgi:hypothetical protein
MTPAEISMLIWCAGLKDSWANPTYRPPFTPTFIEASVKTLVSKGLLQQKVSITQGEFYTDSYEVTVKGLFFLEMLCKTPLPVAQTRYEDPRGI